MSEQPEDPTHLVREADDASDSAPRSPGPETREAARSSVSEGSEAGSANEYRVLLPSFEGPLDLLLHLIQKHELDILDIPIAFIAREYVAYIRLMDELSIDVASEYLVMAATLALIKSKSLLPPETAADDGETSEEEEDPRAELIRRLLEYQKYKLAAAQLGDRDVLGRDVFARGADVESSAGPAPLAQLSLFKLVDAFEEVLKRARQVQDHEIDFERISISEKIGIISELLRSRGRQRFEQLFEQDASRAEMIVTFLALLEMTKLRMTHILQDDPLGPILVELRVLEDDEAQEFDEPRGAEAGAAEDDSDQDVLGQRPRRAFAEEHAGELEGEAEDDWEEERSQADPHGVSEVSAESIEEERTRDELPNEHEADADEADTDEADTDEADTDEADTDEADTDEADTDEADTRQADGAVRVEQSPNSPPVQAELWPDASALDPPAFNALSPDPPSAEDE